MPHHKRIEPWDIPENGDPDRPIWVQAEVTCPVCDHYHVASYPFMAPALECGKCGHMISTADTDAVRRFG